MQETRKKILGFSGLALVTGITFIATNIQVPGALATSGSVTDSLTVRIVGAEPSLRITSPASGVVFTDASGHTLNYVYENAVSTSLVYSYINPLGQTIFTNKTLQSLDGLDYNAGEQTIALDFSYGYGTYIYTLKGTGYDSVQAASDSIVVTYKLPEKEEEEGGGTEEDDGEPTVEDSSVSVDLGGSTSIDDPNVYHYQIEVKNPEGETIYTITVEPGTPTFNLPLDDLDAPTSGDDYTITVTPLDISGDPITTIEPTDIPMNPGQIADPSDPVLNDDGSVSVNLGIDSEKVDEVTLNITDPDDPNFNYTLIVPASGFDGKETVEATLINNITGERTKVDIPVSSLLNGRIIIPFGAMGAKSNTSYIIKIITKKDGNKLFETTTELVYPNYLPIPGAGAPDTGALFEKLNISKEDYLVSGILMVSVLGVAAIGVILKKSKSYKKGLKRSR